MPKMRLLVIGDLADRSANPAVDCQMMLRDVLIAAERPRTPASMLSCNVDCSAASISALDEMGTPPIFNSDSSCCNVAETMLK